MLSPPSFTSMLFHPGNRTLPMEFALALPIREDPRHGFVQHTAAGALPLAMQSLPDHAGHAFTLSMRSCAALFRAVHGGQLGMVKDLLWAGVAPDIADAAGYTPLLHAVLRGDAEIVGALQQAGARTDVFTAGGMSPLMMAIHMGNAEVVHALARGGADVDGANADGLTPVMLAVQTNQVQALNALVLNRADVNAVNAHGLTAMAMAVNWNRPAAVSALAAGGAPIHAIRGQGASALMQAALLGHTEVVAALVDAGALIDCHLLVAIQDGWFLTVKALLRIGANPHSIDCNGHSAMAWAMHLGHTHILQALLEASHGRHAVPVDGVHAPAFALLQGHAELNAFMGDIAATHPAAPMPSAAHLVSQPSNASLPPAFSPLQMLVDAAQALQSCAAAHDEPLPSAGPQARAQLPPSGPDPRAFA